MGIKDEDGDKMKGIFLSQLVSEMVEFWRIYFPELNSQELGILLTPFDLKRLESYANNMLDYHVILDLLPTIASLFFQRRLGEEVRLTPVQSSILLALGMQRKTIEDVEVCLELFF